MNELNEYSQRFANILFETFPEWRSLARNDERPDNDPTALLLEIESPNPKVKGLFISTDGNEVTIGFDHWHTHFGWADSDESDDLAKAVEIISEIIEEKLVIAIFTEGEKFCGSVNLLPHEKPENLYGTWTKIRSWRGTYDDEFAN